MKYTEIFTSSLPLLATLVPIIGGFVAALKAVFKFTKSEDMSIKKIKIFLISLIFFFLTNLLVLIILFIIYIIASLSTSNNSTINITLTISTIIIFLIGSISLIIKINVENKYLLTINSNRKHMDDVYEKNRSTKKSNLLSIETASLNGDNKQIKSKILDTKNTLENEVSYKLNTTYNVLVFISFFCLPSANLLFFLISLYNKIDSLSIITAVILVVFNIMLIYRDIGISKGLFSITNSIVKGHIKRYQKELSKKGIKL
ncbi:hypothetical protein [Staphylococcus equorum]|uniref:hypothetical protein n=1 Tax=Staphylococcus equorum TaxID=246432 RepID=UPI001F16A4C7|nr:hypothetical protein [Staphylococcus equorum]MCE5008508.1 hypothetical protein [Staphylococcus equorum]